MTDQPRRCDARIKGRIILPDGSTRAPFCRKWAMKGQTRCEKHRNRSTGPKTEEGMARTLAAMREGRKLYDARMKAEGRKFPWGGFKPGWQKARRAEDARKAEAARLEALPPIEKTRLSALEAIQAMQANLRNNLEASR